MGYAYTELIIPAVLFLNPGKTKEELLDLLKSVKYSDFEEYSENDSWSLEKDDFLPRCFDLESLASHFCLPRTVAFKNFQKKTFDKNGLTIFPPNFYKHLEKKEFSVILHKGNILKKRKIINHAFSYEKLSLGNLYVGIIDGEAGIVNEILSEEKLSDNISKEDSFDDSPRFSYELKITPVQRKYLKEDFFNLEEVYKKYPLFDPENSFDWSKKEGKIYTGLHSEGKYFWKKEKNKYFLDEKTFENICESFNTGFSFGYTDLIMTAEAIKNQAWKLLSYKGDRFMNDFLKDFPSANVVYQKAVYDSHTSIFAKNKKLTNSDFLRMRVSGFLNI